MEHEVTVTIRLTDKLRGAAHKEAKKRELSLSAWIRMLMQDEIDKRTAK
jgi:predicted HicB family RNase H-like nuclease